MLFSQKFTRFNCSIYELPGVYLSDTSALVSIVRVERSLLNLATNWLDRLSDTIISLHCNTKANSGQSSVNAFRIPSSIRRKIRWCCGSYHDVTWHFAFVCTAQRFQLLNSSRLALLEAEICAPILRKHLRLAQSRCLWPESIQRVIIVTRYGILNAQLLYFSLFLSNLSMY